MGVPQGSFNFHIGLDGTVEVARSLRSMKADVSGLTNAWKAQEVNLKSAGDSTKAAETRYKGLSEAIKSQQQVIGELKRQQSDLDTSTDKGAQAFARMQKQVSQAENKLAGMTAQQSRAKDSMKYYESGIADAQSQLKKISDVSESYVKKLQAEGNVNQANTEKLRSMREQYSQMSGIYAKQQSELSRIASESGKASDAYAKQAIRVNELGAKMASTSKNIKGMAMDSVSTSTKLAAMRDVSAKAGTSIKDAFSHAKGTIVGVGFAVGGATAALISGAKSASTLAHSYNETFNLIKLGGESAADSTKEVSQMQKDGAKYSTMYGVSQQKIADAYQDLVKRGYTGKQAIGAMQTELQASVASGDDFNDVVKVSSQVLEAYGMRANSTAAMTRNTKKAVNELAYAADVTSTGFASLGKGMEYAGTVAKGFGVPLSTTSAAMGELSNRGLEADKAGTGLRKVMLSLAKPTKQASEYLSGVGLSVDSFTKKNGDFKNFSDIMGTIGEKTKDMGKQAKGAFFQAIFGTTGTNAAQILAEHAVAVQKLSDRIQHAGDSGVYVQKLAKKNGDDAQMSMARFNQSAKALQIMASAKLLPALSDAADAMSKGLAKKDNQKVIAAIATGIGDMAKGTVDLVRFMMDHTTAVKVFGAAVAGIWATSKVAGFINQVKLAKTLLTELPKSQAIDFTTNAIQGNSMGGALASIKGAGGLSQMTKLGKGVTAAAGAGVAIDSGLDIFKAFKDKNPDSKFKDAGSGIGKAIGGGIGLWFGGPLGAAVGSQIGGIVGKWGGGAVHSFTKGWGAAKKPKDWVGALGFDAKQGANGISKWWDGVQKADKAQDKKFAKQQEQSSKKNKKAWNNFWKDTGKGWNGFWSDVGKNTDKANKSIGKSVDRGTKDVGKFTKNNLKVARKGFTDWLHGTESDMKKYGLVGAFVHDLTKMAKSQALWIKKNEKKWAKGWKGFVGDVKDNMSDAKDKFDDFTENTSKKWTKFKKSFAKSWSEHWNNTVKDLQSALDDSKKNISTWSSNTNKWWAGFKKSFSKSWTDNWNTASKNLKTSLDNNQKNMSAWDKGVNKWWGSFSKSFGKGWNGFWTGLGKFVGSVFDGVKKDLKNAMNAIIGIINGATSGINWVIHSFGGKKETIGKIKKLATGTGAISGQRRPINGPTLAMLNDGPEADPRELVMKANGNAYMHQGTNVIDRLDAGDEVLNASETKMLFNASGIQHYASGTGVVGWLKGLMGGLEQKIKMVTNVVAHPEESFKSMVADKMDMSKIMGDVPSALGKMMKAQTVKQAQKWWYTAWDEINDAINGGGAGGPWAHTPGAGFTITSGFGHRGAVSGGYSTHDGVDFSGASTVHAMHGGTVTREGGAPAGWGGSRGIGESIVIRGDDGYSVIYQELNGKSDHGAHFDVKTGDTVTTGQAIAALGPNGTHVHVGVTKHPMFSIGGTQLSGWDDVTKMHGTSDGTPKKKDGDKSLQKLVHSQLGSGVFKWIAKFLAPLTGGSGDEPSGSGVQRWKPDVIKALKANGFDATGSQVSAWMRVIARESNGNPKAVNNWDSNARAGHPSKGLVQTIDSTFNANKFPGHGNIFNGYDDLLAGIHYMAEKYGRGAGAFATVSGPMGYANGGFANSASVFGEDGLEAAIPMSAVKSSRGYEMLGKTAAAMAQRDGVQDNTQTDKKLDKVVALLTVLVGQDPADMIAAMLGKIELDTNITLNREKVAKAMRPILDTEVARIMKKAGSGRSV